MTPRPNRRPSLLGRLFGRPELPDGFTGELDGHERVLASATVAGGGSLVLTQLGLWIPEDGGMRRVGWEWVSKAVWDQETLVLTEATAQDVGEVVADDVVVIRELPAGRFRLSEPAAVPKIVRERVTSSIRSSSHHEVPGGGALFVQRKVPGQDGITLQVRPDPGTDVRAVAIVAEQVAGRIREAREGRRR